MTQHQKIFEVPLYPYARSADQDAADTPRHKVIVVGAGPIGMAAAIELAQKGIGVIVISSELPEIIGTCDRVLAMREGHIAGEVASYPGQPISQEAIMELSTGTVAESAFEGAPA